MSWLVLVYRPDVGETRSEEHPFDGVEFFGLYETEEEAMNLIEGEKIENPTWYWHIQQI